MTVSVTNEITPKITDKGYFLEEEINAGKALPVLDKGYVRLINAFGTDLDVVNAARASFAKESHELSGQDTRLIGFLARHGHWAVFRHCFITFEMKAPLEVARQAWKYVTGTSQTDSFSTAWSEASKRYITSNLEFYVPDSDEWRSAPENRKQGSGIPLEPVVGEELTERLLKAIDRSQEDYERALELGVAPEMARLFLLGYGMYVSWRYSTSLQGLAFFLNQRLEEGAQSEIQDYARAIYSLTSDNCQFPVSLRELVNNELL